MGVEMHKMIEFEAIYKQKRDNEPIPVLVQFDGMLLHVWHMSDPFYRLFSSDVFQVTNSIARSGRCIKLPSGGRLETDNYEAIELIEHLQKKQTPEYKNAVRLITRWVITLTSLLLILSIAWLFAH